MDLKKTNLKFFTPERRQQVLDDLVTQFKEYQRIASVILVGSSSYGFIDDFSDIDFAIVTFEEYNLLTIFIDWKEKILNSLTIITHFDVRYSPDSLLLGFFTEDFLELNIGFQNTNNITAKRAQWKIAFDKTNSIQKIMEDSWEKTKAKDNSSKLEYLVSGSWHYINSAIIALSRDNYWRVTAEIEKLKNDMLEFIALRHNVKVNHFIDTELMSKELYASLKELLITKFEKKALFIIIKKMVNLYYKEANISGKQFGGINFDYLAKRMNDYLLIMEKKLFH